MPAVTGGPGKPYAPGRFQASAPECTSRPGGRFLAANRSSLGTAVGDTLSFIAIIIHYPQRAPKCQGPDPRVSKKLERKEGILYNKVSFVREKGDPAVA